MPGGVARTEGLAWWQAEPRKLPDASADQDSSEAVASTVSICFGKRKALCQDTE